MRTFSDPAKMAVDPRFALVRARDKAADGRFVYAVKTTGIFCRPSCPSRPAKPENIAFYATPQEAILEGFRPCKRCLPTSGGGKDDLADKMRLVAEYISSHADLPLTLGRLAAVCELSPFHLQRSFKAVMGVSPKEYHSAARLRVFKAELRRGGGVLEAAFEAGYGSTSRIHEQITRGLGMTPSSYRLGGAGETISYAMAATTMGRLMMGATERGVCFVEFGDGDGNLLEKLSSEFPKATLRGVRIEGNEPLNDWMRALDAHLSRGAPRPGLPLDLRGTAFQIRVWRFLLSVKQGEVVTYAEVARGIGAPRAIRAAASACGANRIGVLVPCHRALRCDGGLGGYRWGVARKQMLIDMERDQSAPERTE